jgi:tetratricopeptide (TPR) repeat protein
VIDLNKAPDKYKNSIYTSFVSDSINEIGNHYFFKKAYNKAIPYFQASLYIQPKNISIISRLVESRFNNMPKGSDEDKQRVFDWLIGSVDKNDNFNLEEIDFDIRRDNIYLRYAMKLFPIGHKNRQKVDELLSLRREVTARIGSNILNSERHEEFLKRRAEDPYHNEMYEEALFNFAVYYSQYPSEKILSKIMACLEYINKQIKNEG